MNSAQRPTGLVQIIPYAALPRMVLLTYKMPESIRRIAIQGENDEFDLNVFFSAKGTGKDAKFVYEDYVQNWLSLVRGAYMPTTTDDLKLGHNEKPAMPYSDVRLLSVLTHTFWFLPNVASCYAMANLLKQRQNVFYHDYSVIICAGSTAGIGVAALEPVHKAMNHPLSSKTITLSCGKLTTGVTVRPWTGIFMLRKSVQPGNLFSGCVSCSKSVGSANRRRTQRNYQARVLYLRLRSRPGTATDIRLQPEPER